MTNEVITASFDANYDERGNNLPHKMDVAYSKEFPKKIFFNLYFRNKESNIDDDDIVITMALSDLFSAIGKAIERESD